MSDDEDDRRGKGERRSRTRRTRRRCLVVRAIQSRARGDTDRAGGGGGGCRRHERDREKGRPAPTSSRSTHIARFDEPILENVSFAAKEGETVVVVGESGTGKSRSQVDLAALVRSRVAYRSTARTYPRTFDDALKVRQKMGMVFRERPVRLDERLRDVAYPLREHTH